MQWIIKNNTDITTKTWKILKIWTGYNKIHEVNPRNLPFTKPMLLKKWKYLTFYIHFIYISFPELNAAISHLHLIYLHLQHHTGLHLQPFGIPSALNVDNCQQHQRCLLQGARWPS